MLIQKSNEWKTTFQTWYWYFKYQIISFGLSNTLAIFQGYFNKILAKKQNIFVIVYLDNILIYIKNLGQAHIEGIGWVFENLQKHGLFINLKKCWFHQAKVCILSYVVSI